MAICPYCEEELHIQDLFLPPKKPNKPSEAIISGEMITIKMSSNSYGIVLMYNCPHCNKVLGFSHSQP